MSHLPLSRKVATVAGLAAAYYFTGKLGLALASINPSATAVWPPTGIALAAALIFGPWVWPGVWIGAFLVNLSTAGTVATSLGIATGNTLEAVIGASLVRRFASGPDVFERRNDIFRYAVLAGLLTPALSATIGVTILAWGGFQSWGGYGATWLTWWLGDVGGALGVAPFLVLWIRSPRPSWTGRQVVELVLLLLTVTVGALLVFGIVAPPLSGHPLKFMMAPALVWAAFRFAQREVASAMLVLTGIAVWGTLRSPAAPVASEPNQSLLVLQAFLAVFSVTFLAFAASVAYRRRTEASLRLLTEALEQRVIDNTGRLQAARLELRSQAGEHARTEEELRASEARLREAQEVGRIGSWEWDIERNVVWWSDALYSIYGLDPAGFGASFEAFLDRVHPDDRARVHENVAAALRDRQPYAIDFRIVRPEGDLLTIHSRGRVITDLDGKAIRMSGTAQDISERQRAEEARAQLMREQSARREAEQESRLKDDFLATLSHELRNPLHAILIWVRLLREGRLDRPERLRAVEAIRQSAELQKRLIYDLLDLSRIASGQLSLRREPVNPAAVIRSVLETMEPMARAGGITLEAQVQDADRTVVGDPARIQQVVWNLLLNAIQFTPGGGRVRLTLVLDSSTARIVVADDGPGIDPESATHIFDRFRRGNPLSPQRSDGLGLGLAVVKHLTELHGGSVSAHNRDPGPGAVFTVTLPLASHPALASLEESAPPSGPPPTAGHRDHPIPQTLRGTRILVVDDDPDAKDALALLLTSRGAEVVSAPSCAAAMTLIQQAPPDLLISDIGMPDGDGFDLLARVRALPDDRCGAMPAIAMTGYARAEDSDRAIQAGYQAHLAKPLDPRDFLVAVEGLLRRQPVAAQEGRNGTEADAEGPPPGSVD